MNNSQCWFTSQVNGGTGVNLIPPVYGNQQTLTVPRFDNANVQQGHNFLPKLSQSNGKGVNGSPNVVLCEASGFANGGMPSCYAPLLIPNTGFVTAGNYSPYLTVPQFSNDFFSTCWLLKRNNLKLQHRFVVSNHVDGRYLWSPNQIPTLPSVQVSGTSSVPSVVSNTTVGNQSSSSSSVANSVKVKSFFFTKKIEDGSLHKKQQLIVTDPSITTSMKKTSSTASVASSVSSNNSNSSSIWSEKQREVGNIIYRELQSEFPSRVAKLTGMLLSLPKDELNLLITDSSKLKARARQFCRLLDNK
ncbi:hypothetical protein RFI_17014 [Reticulomyxa filosa]|uniref:PABC domain-containing protein n=1 Tax=Reticulomyxa filosa TaxID=46433 RepID=X6N2S4_RETFI|nr:hypothetical protein RFI_17014 [Reticulomyxa filosa]|eukprot:ETO20203.1 hypothetical protein RFI_17014 [Reticulomyxa filosa]